MPTHKLMGRWGPYTPRTPQERARARKQAEQRRQEAARAAAWLERTRWCRAGCGQEAARWPGPALALRFGGCCSSECEAALRQRDLDAPPPSHPEN